MPLSASPNAPLYPLHQLLFDQEQLSPADQAHVLLASARQALDRATVNTGAARIAELDQAQRDLADARALLPQIADPATRGQIDTELTRLEQQANEIGTAGQQGTNEQDGQNGDNRQPSADATSGQGDNPQDDPNGTHGGSDLNSPQDR